MKKRHSTKGLRTWIEVDRSRVAKNYATFRKMIKPDCLLMSVVKSNAYGHELISFAKEMETLGVDWLGVDSIVEGTALRKAGIFTPILVLGYTAPECIESAVKHKMSITVSNQDTLDEVLKYAKGLSGKEKLSIHIKADTGMHRQGFMKDKVAGVADLLNEHQGAVIVEGLYTHFAEAKNSAEKSNTHAQIENFNEVVKVFSEKGINPIIHACATGGAMLFPEAHFDMVRIGIGMYGAYPSKEAREYAEEKHPLTPALSWKTIIAEVKDLPDGGEVGYDFTDSVTKDSRIAVCPIGYWHGYTRALSSLGFMLVGGKRARIVGRISMDMVVLDITGISDVKVGNEVVVIGEQGEEKLHSDEQAFLAKTTSYEFLTCINPLIARLYS